MTTTELLKRFEDYRGKLRDTDDPVLLAGGYLKWADSDPKRAIAAPESHDGRFIDRPPFAGREAALELLKKATA